MHPWDAQMLKFHETVALEGPKAARSEFCVSKHFLKPRFSNRLDLQNIFQQSVVLAAVADGVVFDVFVALMVMCIFEN